MAPAPSRLQAMDFLQASPRRDDFVAARSQEPGSSHDSRHNIRPGRFAGGLTAWCQGVVDQLERAVPDARLRQEALVRGLTAIPSFGTCVPSIRCGPVAIAVGSARRPRLQSTVTFAKDSARRRRTGEQADGEDSKPEDTVSTLAMHAANHFRGVSFRSMSSAASTGLAAFFAAGPRAAELRASTCGMLAQLLAPMASGGGLALQTGSPVGMAFCPIDFGCMSNFKAPSISQCAPIRELTMQELEKGVLVATFVQGSLGIVRMCLGDVFSGAYGLLLATLGYNSRRPGPASNWLKTYVLITFINGTMSGIDLLQNVLLHNYPVIAPALPLAVNGAHLVTLLVPWVSFLGAYCGWQHIKMQRKATIEAYQEQMMRLMQQPPWPPPPLFPLPGMPAFQMVEDSEAMMGAPPGFQHIGAPPGGASGGKGHLRAVQEIPGAEAEAEAAEESVAPAGESASFRRTAAEEEDGA